MKDLTTDNIAAFEAATEYFTLDGLSRTERRVFSHISPARFPKVLDAGAGAGRTTIELKRRGFDVTGFDIAKNLVEYGNRRYPEIGLLHMDARDISERFRKESFDMVVFAYNGLDCLHLESERMSVMRQIYDVLKPGGLFVYQSHNAWYRGAARARWMRRDGPYFEEVSGPRNMRLVFYAGSPLTQAAALRQVGFRKVQTRGFLPIFHLLNWIFDYAPIYIARK